MNLLAMSFDELPTDLWTEVAKHVSLEDGSVFSSVCSKTQAAWAIRKTQVDACLYKLLRALPCWDKGDGACLEECMSEMPQDLHGDIARESIIATSELVSEVGPVRVDGRYIRDVVKFLVTGGVCPLCREVHSRSKGGRTLKLIVLLDYAYNHGFDWIEDMFVEEALDAMDGSAISIAGFQGLGLSGFLYALGRNDWGSFLPLCCAIEGWMQEAFDTILVMTISTDDQTFDASFYDRYDDYETALNHIRDCRDTNAQAYAWVCDEWCVDETSSDSDDEV